MIMDELLEFGNAATIIGTAASAAVLGDVIDTGATARDLGTGFPVRLRIQIATSVAATGGASNVTFKLVSDSVSTLDSSPTEHWSSAAIAKATLVAGYVVVDMVLPAQAYERYLGVTYTPDTNDTTTGAADAFLNFDTARMTLYPNAI